MVEVFRSSIVDHATRIFIRRDLTSRRPKVRRGRRPVASTNEIIREILGIEPREMADMFDQRWEDRPGTTFDADPEAAGRVGLLMLMGDAPLQMEVIREREVDQIRLMSDAEAREEGWANSRAAQLTTLISAALLHGDPRDVTLLSPCDPLPGREDLLMAVARDVYFFGSGAAFRGFEILCDDDVRFGVNLMFNKARRLLWRVGKEQDPNGDRLQRMPIAVAEALTLIHAADIRSRDSAGTSHPT